MSTLVLGSVSKAYEVRGALPRRALEPVSLKVDGGEFVSFVGPSGCGKTTLLRICAGLIEASDGEISYRGQAGPIPPRHYSMVFQSDALLPWRTILGNVTLPTEIQKSHLANARDRAVDLLRMVGIADVVDNYPHQLSGGMRQRAAIARALITDPDMLLMDEPFGALDAMTRDELQMELQEIHSSSKKTILFITHSIAEAAFLSDRVVVLKGQPGSVADVVDIDVPRPRRERVDEDQRFGPFTGHIRNLLANDNRSAG